MRTDIPIPVDASVNIQKAFQEVQACLRRLDAATSVRGPEVTLQDIIDLRKEFNLALRKTRQSTWADLFGQLLVKGFLLRLDRLGVGLDPDAGTGATWTVLGLGGNSGVKAEVKFSIEEVTIAAAATSDSAANLLLANSVVLGVVTRVRVKPPGTATMGIGTALDATRFATAASTTLNQTAVGTEHFDGNVTTVAGGPTQAAAAKVRITPDAPPSDATGRVAVHVLSIVFTAPIS